MNPIGAGIALVTISIVLFASRGKALLAFVFAGLFLIQEVQINIAGINFFAFRFLELAAFYRVMSRKEFSFSRLCGIDKILIFFYSYVTIVYLLRASDLYAYQIGLAVDAFLTYFAFRGLLSNFEEIADFLKGFALILVPYVLIVWTEFLTRFNAFSLLGAAGPGSDSDIWDRNGRPRCWGSFRHPSLLGTLGGTFFPIFIGLFFIKKYRKMALVGMLCSFLIVIASNSGGPLNCIAISMLGWAAWKVRKHMRVVRWIIVILIVAIGSLMKSPIWYLVARASDISGGDGWHRSYLMDIAYQNLHKWWFVGMSMDMTRDWFPYTNGATGNADITNEYLIYGLTAGLGGMFLFVYSIKVVFSQIGKTLKYLRDIGLQGSTAELFLWGLGAMIATHCVNWFGIIYFDQTYVFWFLQLAIIANLTEQIKEAPDIAHLKGELPVFS